jgi:hypothetical protein
MENTVFWNVILYSMFTDNSGDHVAFIFKVLCSEDGENHFLENYGKSMSGYMTSQLIC